MTRAQLAVVGASWGGLDAVGRLLADLRSTCQLAIAVAQHRSAEGPREALVKYLRSRCLLPVAEVVDKQTITAGRVYLAPADYHMLVEPGHFALSLEAPVQYSRPSIDVLFESAAEAYGSEVVAVILTGANADGAAGIRRIHQAGGRTFAQDPRTAEKSEMPAAAIATGMVDQVLSIEEIASELNRLGSAE